MSGHEEIHDAADILDQRYRDQIPNWDEEVLEEELRLRVGIAIIKMRKEAGLTQQQLAEQMGITQSMVSQLENADYDGSALDMLWRACRALRRELHLSCREPGSRRRSCRFALGPTQAHTTTQPGG